MMLHPPSSHSENETVLRKDRIQPRKVCTRPMLLLRMFRNGSLHSLLQRQMPKPLRTSHTNLFMAQCRSQHSTSTASASLLWGLSFQHASYTAGWCEQCKLLYPQKGGPTHPFLSERLSLSLSLSLSRARALSLSLLFSLSCLLSASLSLSSLLSLLSYLPHTLSLSTSLSVSLSLSLSLSFSLSFFLSLSFFPFLSLSLVSFSCLFLYNTHRGRARRNTKRKGGQSRGGKEKDTDRERERERERERPRFPQRWKGKRDGRDREMERTERSGNNGFSSTAKEESSCIVNASKLFIQSMRGTRMMQKGKKIPNIRSFPPISKGL